VRDEEADRIDRLIQWHTAELPPTVIRPGASPHATCADTLTLDAEAAGAA
jgi:hypothetical protein